MQRAKQAFAHQFVEWEMDEEDEILPKLQETECADGDNYDGLLKPRELAGESRDGSGGQHPQGHVPHVGIAQIHPVFHIAHDDVARRDKDDKKPIDALVAPKKKQSAE